MSFENALHTNIAIRYGSHQLDRTQVISSSYGNDSVALIQWAYEQGYKDVHVVFIDTGWAREGWLERVYLCEQWVRTLGFKVHHLDSQGFEKLIAGRKGFPNQRYQWCSAFLKGLPFLDWIEQFDTECTATVMIGKRRAESRDRIDIGEWITHSEYHGGRTIRHPLFAHSDDQRNEILIRAGFEPLPHRSQECAPCVNANRGDILLLTEREIVRVECLEFETDQTMFRPKRHMGAKGIRQVVQWAKAPRGKYAKDEPTEFTCSSGYCGF